MSWQIGTMPGRWFVKRSTRLQSGLRDLRREHEGEDSLSCPRWAYSIRSPYLPPKFDVDLDPDGVGIAKLAAAVVRLAVKDTRTTRRQRIGTQGKHWNRAARVSAKSFLSGERGGDCLWEEILGCSAEEFAIKNFGKHIERPEDVLPARLPDPVPPEEWDW